MPTVQEWKSFVRAMREDPRTRFLGSTLILSFLLFKVGIICYSLDNSNKAFLYVILSACALWLFLIFCGWTIRQSMNPFSNLCTFIYCSFVLVIVLGLTTIFIFLLLSLYNEDNKVNFDVTDVTLTEFSISNNMTTVNYNLTVKVVVGPNKKKHGVHYDTLLAWASYQGLNFTSLSLPPFYVGGRSNHTYNSSTVVLQPLVFQGHQELVLPPDGFKYYQQDEAAGRFSIDVALSYAGLRGRHQLKGVSTFALKQLALPNAASGWVEGDEDPVKGQVDGDIAGISVSAFLFLCFLGCCWCAAEDRNIDTGGFICVCVFLLTPLITIAICVPDLVRALKKVDQVKFDVSNAILTEFSLTSPTGNISTLIYNLSTAVTVGPNHKKTGVYFDKLEATAYYQGQNLTSVALSPFYLQGRQRDGSRTVILRPVFQGQQMLTVGDGLKKFREETAARRYSIVVTLSYSGIRTDDYDYSNSSVVNETMTKADHHHQLKNLATFDLKVPLLAGGVVSNAAAADVHGFRRQHGFNFLFVMISGLLIYGSL